MKLSREREKVQGLGFEDWCCSRTLALECWWVTGREWWWVAESGVWWQKAFKASIAMVLQNKGISAIKSKDVVIVSVCDDSG